MLNIRGRNYQTYHCLKTIQTTRDGTVTQKQRRHVDSCCVDVTLIGRFRYTLREHFYVMCDVKNPVGTMQISHYTSRKISHETYT